MAASFLARTGLSTTSGRRKNSARGELLDRTKVEVLEDCADLCIGEPAMVFFHDHAPVPEGSIGHSRWRFIDQHDVYRAFAGVLESRNQLTEIERAEALPRFETDGDVEVAARVCGSTCIRAEYEGVGDTRVFGQ